MHIEEHGWHSPHLGKHMNLKVYGHYGQPVIVFPCSCGRYFDYEGMGMIDAVSDHINRGKIKLFCVDSVDAESWYAFHLTPYDRNARHEAYDRYITQEVIPMIRSHCQSPDIRIMANGCSMGAYHSVNFFLKHPDLFCGTIALSGLYSLERSEFQLGADDMGPAFFNSPVHYFPSLTDSQFLGRMRQAKIIICAGQGAYEEAALEDTRSLDHGFREKGIDAWIDYWGYDVNHDWPWWYVQMNYFLDRLYS